MYPRQSTYIDPLVELFAKYSSVPIVAIIEPDSLPNLVTNQGNPHCGNAGTQCAVMSEIELEKMMRYSIFANHCNTYCIKSNHKCWSTTNDVWLFFKAFV